MRLQNLTGSVFGQLTVIERAESVGRVRWRCVCACGREASPLAGDLRSGKTKTCGCRTGLTESPRSSRRGPTPEPINGGRVCRRCHIEKGEEHFRRLSRNPQRREWVCTSCRYKAQAEQIDLKNPKGPDGRRIYSPEEAKRRDEYRRSWYQKNRDRVLAKSHEHYLANKEKVNARARDWGRRHPEYNAARAAQRRTKRREPHAITPAGVLDLLKKQKGKCAACRRDIRKAFTLDHIIPVAAGGGNEPSNIQLLCRWCNSEKHTKHAVEFMQKKGYLL